VPQKTQNISKTKEFFSLTGVHTRLYIHPFDGSGHAYEDDKEQRAGKI
jgi:hypothetical protein